MTELNSKSAESPNLTDLPDRFRQIYIWASQNTAEARGSQSQFKYFWPDAAKTLLTNLELSRGQVIAFLGLSGVGKSSAQREIAKRLSEDLKKSYDAKKELARSEEKEGERERETRVIYFKWPGSFDANYPTIQKILEAEGFVDFRNELFKRAAEKIRTDPASLKKFYKLVPYSKISSADFKDEDLLADIQKEGYSVQSFIEEFFRTYEIREIEKNLIVSCFAGCHSLLIDMQDYATDEKRSMLSDIFEIGRIWERITNNALSKDCIGKDPSHKDMKEAPPNLVVVLQKELAVDDQGVFTHYFLGKARFIELKPFSSPELVEAFRNQFNSDISPFTEDALNWIAMMSRGIFRRFLKYTKNSLEREMKRFFSLPLEQQKSIEMVIDDSIATDSYSDDEMKLDWTGDLKRMFPRSDNQANLAYTILCALMDEGPVNQKDLTQLVSQYLSANGKYGSELSEAEATRLLVKLEQYGYVKRTQTANGKLVEFNI
jgi:hypothetical protein